MQPVRESGARGWLSARPLVAPLLVLLVALSLTGVGWAIADSYARDHDASRFHADADQLEVHLRERIATYETVLRGARGLFDASDRVSRAEWAAYITSLDIGRNHPGVQAVGYAADIPPDELAAHEATVRAEGFPTYTVFPVHERDVYTAIVFIEPFRDRNLRAFGYDMFSDPVRREAMERARDTGEPALTGRVTLVQESAQGDVQPGFLLYLAVYRSDLPQRTVEERREALMGYVYCPFRAEDFMRLTLPSAPRLEFEVYDGAEAQPAALLYDSDPATVPGAPYDGLVRTTRVELAGETWTLVEQRPARSNLLVAALPWAVLAGGIISSGLLFGLAYGLATTRQRALALAHARTAELERKTRDLQTSNEALEAFTFVVSHDLKEPVRGVEAYLRALLEDHEATMDTDAVELAQRAHQSTERLSALLQNLLQLSRVTRVGLSLQAVTLEEVVRSDECRLAYEALAQERGAKVEVAPGPAVLAAPGVLAQAVGNLVANAIRHGGAGARRVRVRATPITEERVEVVVEDDGRGFSREQEERFNRGDVELRAGGFGLLIAQRAVERLGGRLWLSRSEGLGGAAVRFTLPAA